MGAFIISDWLGRKQNFDFPDTKYMLYWTTILLINSSISAGLILCVGMITHN